MGDETIAEIIQRIIKEKIRRDKIDSLELLNIAIEIEKEVHRIYKIKFRERNVIKRNLTKTMQNISKLCKFNQLT
jgi:hypothetical protein